MGKRGPKPLVSHEERLQELKKHDVFDKGNLKKESDPIWSIICDNLNKNNTGNKITIRNIHRYVSQDRNKILRDLRMQIVKNKAKVEIKLPDKVFDEEKILLGIQSNVLYKPIIKEFSSYPLNIFHYSFEAIDFALEFLKTKEFLFANVGSFCEEFVAPDGSRSGKINLFSLGVQIHGKLIPICQLTSEENVKSIFQRFFMDSIRNGLCTPTKLVLDYNKQHLMAVMSVFNVNLSYEKYLLMCFQSLFTNNIDCVLPTCLIKTDVRLIILKVLQWDCMKRIALDSVKYFYIYCVILLSLQENILDFEEILQNIFFLCLSRLKYENTHKTFEYIILKIQSQKIQENYNREYIASLNSKNIEDCDTIILDYSNCEAILNYVKVIVCKAKQCIVVNESEKQDQNVYFNENFCRYLMKLCIEFVVSTKIVFKSQYENDLTFIEVIKNYEDNFKNYLIAECGIKIPVNEYLLKNIDYTDILLQEACDSFSHKKLPEKEKEKTVDHSFLHYEENWMGLKELSCKNDKEEEEEESNSDSESSIDSNLDVDNVDDDADMLDVNNDFKEETLSSIINSLCGEKTSDDAMYEPENSTVNENPYEKRTVVFTTQTL